MSTSRLWDFRSLQAAIQLSAAAQTILDKTTQQA